MLGDEDLNDTDRVILDELNEGRVTPQYLAKQLDITRQYASTRLKRFVEHGVVEKIASGLYELDHDPRSSS